MYEAHYGLSDSPFRLAPDGRLFYASRPHSRANAHLTYGLSQDEGFIVVTGEVGAGKTTLIQRLCQGLDPNRHVIARLSTTQLSGDEMLRLAAAGFGVVPGADKAAMLLALQAALRHQRRAGRRCLLIVDEVQNLPFAALEELRMLSNLTDDGSASLQTILVGQPQFRRILASPDLDQLRQRVLVSCHLSPLEAADTRAYIEHRLHAVGWRDNPTIDDAAFAAVHRHSGGVPRRINRLAGRVLLHAALDQATAIDEAMVEGVANELREDLEGGAPAVAPAVVEHGAVEPGTVTRLFPPVSPVEPDEGDVLDRIEMLELKTAQRERLFQRLRHALVGR